MANLVDSEIARLWLENFKEEDVDYARELAESITLVSTSEVEGGLDARIAEVSQSHKSGSIALFGAREVDPLVPEDAEPPFGWTGKTRSVYVDGEKRQVLLRWFRNKHLQTPVSYFGDGKDKTPSRSRAGVPTGSEAMIGTLIRDICERNGKAKWLDHPSINQMLQTKSKTIVLLDDIIGSGTRIRTFIRSFFDHPTIRSWFSLKLFKVHVACYAATTCQLDSLASHPRIEKVHCCVPLHAGDSTWNVATRNRIVKLCRDYAGQTTRPELALGYKDAFTNICFDYKCPNTAPAILWAGGGRQNWKPLFSVRPRLDIKDWPKSLDDNERQKRVLNAIRQKKLSDAIQQPSLTDSDRQIIVVLGLISRGIRTTQKICSALQIPESTCVAILGRCRALGLIANMRVTQAGRNEIRFAKKRNRNRKRDMQDDNRYYYPMSLRASKR